MKLLASDFDNTLWFHDHMKERDVKTIKEFQKQGNLFGVCTGRCLQGIVNPSQPYNLEHDFYILLNLSFFSPKYCKNIIFIRNSNMVKTCIF